MGQDRLRKKCSNRDALSSLDLRRGVDRTGPQGKTYFNREARQARMPKFHSASRSSLPIS